MEASGIGPTAKVKVVGGTLTTNVYHLIYIIQLQPLVEKGPVLFPASWEFILMEEDWICPSNLVGPDEMFLNKHVPTTNSIYDTVTQPSFSIKRPRGTPTNLTPQRPKKKHSRDREGPKRRLNLDI